MAVWGWAAVWEWVAAWGCDLSACVHLQAVPSLEVSISVRPARPEVGTSIAFKEDSRIDPCEPEEYG